MPIIFPKEPRSPAEIFNRFEKQVPGLRSAAPPGPVRVYKANPDGTPGKFLRIEQNPKQW